MRGKHILIVLSVVAAMAAVAVVVSAGNPDNPPEPPEITNSYTLEDIYNRLNAGTAGSQSAFTEPSAGPETGTMRTINEIMEAAPALDNTNGATPTQVLSGTTYWGLQDEAWGPQTGTMSDHGAGSTIVPTTTNQSLPAGYWSSANTVQGDSALVEGNIVSGTSIFGVDGSAVTASGDAVDANVLTGVTYSNDSGASTGTMPNNGAGSTIVPATTNQSLAAGYWSSANTVQGDSDLVAGSIKSGVNLFGVDGAYYAPVPQTGQTTSYTDTTGEDGDLEIGVEWPDPRFITGTLGVVTDTLTGLVWLENANCVGGGLDWGQALTEANTLKSGDCGLDDGSIAGDWRLPNVREMQSLTDYGTYSPALPHDHPFTGVLLPLYWSSTSYATGTSLAWYMSLNDGRMDRADKTYAYGVWPVRGGQ